MKKDRGLAKPINDRKSVRRMQNVFCPQIDSDCRGNHKYKYAAVGPANKQSLDTIFNQYDLQDPVGDSPERSQEKTVIPSAPISLSYFTRPNTTNVTSEQFPNPRQRIAAKDMIEQKKAQLLAILSNSKIEQPAEEPPKEKEMEEGEQPPMEGEEE